MRPRANLQRAAIKRPHRYAWLWEPLETDATFVLRSMFGTKTAYLDGKIMLCFSAGEEPWRGLLVCTDRERQPGLIAEFPELVPHAILPKWLYLPEASDRFEAVAARLVRLARSRDPRLGVIPKPKRKRPSRVRP
ncbi:hypothetical protein Verru16b_02957 [Lacunisphaera limnophila]|uniref:MmcQ/YjbR family DNA-binding protein n=1 Tax=Lacunisphaera limnophila TaxID=1838286 RepID=A0A1D8AY98_9BACT|nr:hypothetical protein [Lacunisphaera limnophila]AOS45866.1 hypothetical protein Verru16b_02957 [Lacunisphaera limnophila]